jgi:hypothetical protein
MFSDLAVWVAAVVGAEVVMVATEVVKKYELHLRRK